MSGARVASAGVQVVFTVDRSCQLLGVGLCGTEGAYTVELELVEVRTRSPTERL